jgi:hypothetical protein
MSATLEEWKVRPHGALTPLEENIQTVEGEIAMPIGNMCRRMTLVRLRDGRLVVFSAISLDEHRMRSVEAFGEPAFLIVPNAHHRLDAKAWKERYPAIRVVAPEGARDKIGEVVAVDATNTVFGDPNVVLLTVPGTKLQESALEITTPFGITLVLNDIVGNIRGAHGFGGWMLRLMGFAGDAPHVPAPVKLAIVADKAALAAQLRRWAGMALKRIVVSHGEIIDRDPQGALQTLAATLD